MPSIDTPPHVGSGRDEREAHGPADAQRERAVAERDLFALFGAAREHADAAPRVAVRRVDDEEVTARRAAADPEADAAPREPIGDGTACNRELGRAVLEQPRPRAPAPIAEDVEHALGEPRAAKDAAIEEDGVGHGECPSRRQCYAACSPTRRTGACAAARGASATGGPVGGTRRAGRGKYSRDRYWCCRRGRRPIVIHRRDRQVHAVSPSTAQSIED